MELGRALIRKVFEIGKKYPKEIWEELAVAFRSFITKNFKWLK